MRTFIVYKSDSDYYRQVADWLGDFNRQTGKTIEEVDPDSPTGADTCRTYDIVEYPSVVALDGDGVMQNMWKGLPLPTISEVSYYVQ